MCTKSLIVQVSASIMCKKHLWWPVTWNETQCGARGGCQRRLGARVVVVAVESSPLSTGRTCVEKRMTSITMPMINTVTRTQIIVQRVLRHHILRCTRWDVFLNVAAFTQHNSRSSLCQGIQWILPHTYQLLSITDNPSSTVVSFWLLINYCSILTPSVKWICITDLMAL